MTKKYQLDIDYKLDHSY